jgi:hypothetical protein
MWAWQFLSKIFCVCLGLYGPVLVSLGLSWFTGLVVACLALSCNLSFVLGCLGFFMLVWGCQGLSRHVLSGLVWPFLGFSGLVLACLGLSGRSLIMELLTSADARTHTHT